MGSKLPIQKENKIEVLTEMARLSQIRQFFLATTGLMAIGAWAYIENYKIVRELPRIPIQSWDKYKKRLKEEGKPMPAEE